MSGRAGQTRRATAVPTEADVTCLCSEAVPGGWEEEHRGHGGTAQIYASWAQKALTPLQRTSGFRDRRACPVQRLRQLQPTVRAGNTRFLVNGDTRGDVTSCLPAL